MSILDEIGADLVAKTAADELERKSKAAVQPKKTRQRSSAAATTTGKRKRSKPEVKTNHNAMETDGAVHTPPKATAKGRKAKTGEVAEPGYYSLKIRNYVSNFYLDTPLNLWQTCMVMRGRCSYPVFTSGTIKGRLPSVTFEIFENGKVGMTGVSSPCHAVTAMWQFCARASRLLQRKIHPRDYRNHNVVGSLGLGYGLNLDLFYDDYQSTATYSPDKFPGLHYHMESPRLVFLLYKSGKMVITQGKETKDLQDGFKVIDWSKYRIGHEYRQVDASHRRSRVTPEQFANAAGNDDPGKLNRSLQRLNETNSCDCEVPQWVPSDLQNDQWMCLTCSTVARLKLDG